MPDLIEATDPRGKVVHCTQERWNEHIIGGWHSELAGHEADVQRALESPLFICADADFADREIYYYRKLGKALYIKVVVRFATASSIGFVVTAFYTDSGKAGEKLLWTASSQS